MQSMTVEIVNIAMAGHAPSCRGAMCGVQHGTTNSLYIYIIMLMYLIVYLSIQLNVIFMH